MSSGGPDDFRYLAGRLSEGLDGARTALQKLDTRVDEMATKIATMEQQLQTTEQQLLDAKAWLHELEVKREAAKVERLALAADVASAANAIEKQLEEQKDKRRAELLKRTVIELIKYAAVGGSVLGIDRLIGG